MKLPRLWHGADSFSSLAFFWGNFWGKTEMIVIGAALTFGRRRFVPVATASSEASSGTEET